MKVQLFDYRRDRRPRVLNGKHCREGITVTSLFLRGRRGFPDWLDANTFTVIFGGLDVRYGHPDNGWKNPFTSDLALLQRTANFMSGELDTRLLLSCRGDVTGELTITGRDLRVARVKCYSELLICRGEKDITGIATVPVVLKDGRSSAVYVTTCYTTRAPHGLNGHMYRGIACASERNGQLLKLREYVQFSGA